MASRDEILRALENVYDTCSLFNRTNLNIVEMGLVRDIESEGPAVRVSLLLTDPACVYFFEIARRIEEEVTALPGVGGVEVCSTWDAIWGPERMAPAARERLARLRAERLSRLQEDSASLEGIRPRREEDEGVRVQTPHAL